MREPSAGARRSPAWRISRTRPASRWALASLAALSPACRTSHELDARPSGVEAEPPAALEPRRPAEAPSHASDRPLVAPDSTPVEPEAIMVARRDFVAYREPRPGDGLREVVPRGQPFAVYGRRPGPGCSGPGWWVLAPDAFACPSELSPSAEPPRDVARLEPLGALPFVYAKANPDRPDPAAPIPRWRHRAALARGDDPSDSLPATGSFAFVKRHRSGTAGSWIDAHGRAVRGGDLRAFRPSTFRGVDPREHPAGIAWVIDPKAQLSDGPGPSKRAAQRLGHHERVIPREPERAGEYVAVELGSGRLGYVERRAIRIWSSPPPLEVGEPPGVWVDVDLDQQVLTLMEGRQPIWATLISSGKPGDGTPLGIYRIRMKKAWGTMRSLPDADEPYYVEAVPWAQYFHQRYALHGAYWHDRFGRRTSHGCVNLSPYDAQLVFRHTAPIGAPGWLTVMETERDPGTILRIRRGAAPVADRRTALDAIDPELDD